MTDAASVVRVKRTDIVTYSCEVPFGELAEKLRVHPETPLADLLALITAQECDMSRLGEYLERNQKVKTESSTWVATLATQRTDPSRWLPALAVAAQVLDRLLALRAIYMHNPDPAPRFAGAAPDSSNGQVEGWRAVGYFDWLNKILDDLAPPIASPQDPQL